MSKCKYCGKDAGWLKSKHAACEAKHTEGSAAITKLLLACFHNKTDFYLHEAEIKSIEQSSFINSTDRTNIFVGALDIAVNQYLDDNFLDASEKNTLNRFVQFSGLSTTTLNEHNSIHRVLQSEVLTDIINGRKPQPNITISGPLPFMLGKTETIVWLFRNITFYEQKVRRDYVGRSSGVSFKVCKGVYYRLGGFKGRPIETTYMQHIGTGMVCLTDKNLYFSSSEKSVKIPFNKILNLETYSNVLGVQRDGASAKPLFFENLDSWFCYNVIVNLKD